MLTFLFSTRELYNTFPKAELTKKATEIIESFPLVYMALNVAFTGGS